MLTKYRYKGCDHLLTAITKEGKYVSLLDVQLKEPLLEKLRNQTFICPTCQSPLILKAGKIRIPHFAHMKPSNCSSFASEPESFQHLLGKQHLYTLLRKLEMEVYLEQYIPKIRQRPDLLLIKEGRYVAVEFQCTPIPFDQIKSRTIGYIKNGITPLWVIGGKPYVKRNKRVFTLTSFHWSLAKQRDRLGLTLLGYDPMQRSFHLLSQISPLSSKKVLASFTSWPIEQEKIFVHTEKDYVHYYQIWYQQKQKWVQQKVIYANVTDPFQKIVYENGHNLFLLPVICGLPVKHMYYFESHPLEWQYYLFTDCFQLLKTDQRISLKYMGQQMRKRMNKGDIRLRDFPMEKRNRWDVAIKEYMLFLTAIGYFRKISEHLFEKVKTIDLPKNTQQATDMEQHVYQKLKHQTFANEKSKLETSFMLLMQD